MISSRCLYMFFCSRTNQHSCRSELIHYNDFATFPRCVAVVRLREPLRNRLRLDWHVTDMLRPGGVPAIRASGPPCRLRQWSLRADEPHEAPVRSDCERRSVSMRSPPWRSGPPSRSACVRPNLPPRERALRNSRRPRGRAGRESASGQRSRRAGCRRRPASRSPLAPRPGIGR